MLLKRERYKNGHTKKRERERETFLFEQVWWVDFSSARLQYERQTGFERTSARTIETNFFVLKFSFTLYAEKN